MKKKKWLIALAIFLCLLSITIWLSMTPLISSTSKDAANYTTLIDEAQSLITEEGIYSVSKEDLLEGALKGMTNAIKDPYSMYYTEEEAKMHRQSLASERVGIGIELTEANNSFIIISAIKKSPAYKAGVLPLDELVQVDQTRLEGKSMKEVLTLLQGGDGETVEITVFRPSAARHYNFRLKREKLPNQTVEWSVVKERDHKVGIIEVHLFGESTSEEWVRAIKSLQEEKAEALLIDLRDNPGGYLQATTEMLGTFSTKEKLFAYMENAKGELLALQTKVNESLSTDTVSFLQELPIVILQNGGSASAAEVFTSALKEWDKATIIGEKSFGKGTVQETWPLSNGGEMKLTTHKWLTVAREWIHGVGLTPHIMEEPNPLRQLQYQLIINNYKKEDFSSDIAFVQQVLAALGFSVARTDGYFDDSTEDAIRQYRKHFKLVDGNSIDEIFLAHFMHNFQVEKGNRDNDPQYAMGISFLLHELEQ